jgi:hypothetical protein
MAGMESVKPESMCLNDTGEIVYSTPGGPYKQEIPTVVGRFSEVYGFLNGRRCVNICLFEDTEIIPEEVFENLTLSGVEKLKACVDRAYMTLKAMEGSVALNK